MIKTELANQLRRNCDPSMKQFIAGSTNDEVIALFANCDCGWEINKADLYKSIRAAKSVAQWFNFVRHLQKYHTCIDVELDDEQNEFASCCALNPNCQCGCECDPRYEGGECQCGCNRK